MNFGGTQLQPNLHINVASQHGDSLVLSEHSVRQEVRNFTVQVCKFRAAALTPIASHTDMKIYEKVNILETKFK